MMLLKTNDRKVKYRLALAFVASAALIPSANACYVVNVHNDSDEAITAVWGAGGCAGVYEDKINLEFMCEHKDITAGGRDDYNYNWGTTAPTLTLVYKDGGSGYNYREFHYHNDAFREVQPVALPETVPHCGMYFTVHFTQDMLN
ncbi:MAG: hypothetical protein AAFX54_03030 [Pseudomonadota bacterium]